MSTTDVIILLVAGFLSGAINSVAGGGRVIAFPVLLAFMPAVQANATCMIALGLGIVGSCFGFRQHIPAVRPWLFRFGWASFAGGLLGAWLLTVTPPQSFANLAPFLMLFATLLFMVQGPLRRWAGRHHAPCAAPETPNFAFVAAQFFIAIYGGYFGAGIGILMLAVFGFMGFDDIHRMNTLKTILSAIVTLVAAAYYVYAGLIDWPHAIWVTLGATVGYFFGAHFSQQIPQTRVRQLIVAIGLAISAWMMWKLLA